MLEISIFCVILFAIAYWATLFIMGRREDVLHGEFVEAEPELVEAAMPASAPMPVFPPKPIIKRVSAPEPAPVAVTAPQPAPAASGRTRAGKTRQRGSAAIAAGVTQARTEERRADPGSSRA
jgi:hypothetical protein